MQGNGLQVDQGNVVEIFIFHLDKATGELHCQLQVNAECCNVANFMFYVGIDICQLSITVNKRSFFITQANMMKAWLSGLHIKTRTKYFKVFKEDIT